MPDDEVRENFLSKKHQKGIKRLEHYLNRECSKKPIKLTERQIAKYKKRFAVAGWAIQPPNLSRRMIVFVDSRYPFSMPRTIIDPSFSPLIYPHIEEDGYLCISEVSVPKNEDELEAVAQHVIAESIELVKRCLSDSNQNDFKDGILTYWDREKSEGVPKCYSLLDLDKGKTARKIKVWKGIGEKNDTFIADNCEEGERWLSQKLGNNHKRNNTEGLLVWSEKVLMPKEYPMNNQQVCNFLKDYCGSEAFKIFRELAAEIPDKIDIIIGFDTDTGKALTSIVLERPRVSSSYHMTASQELTKGFRAGHVSTIISGNRYSNSNTLIKRSIVQRVDPSWSLSRDSDKRIQVLKEKMVTIIGCGSIGSEISRMLAQNGICNFNLIDHDTMDWENIGRHALGAKAITLNGSSYTKTSVLKNALTSQFPHVKVRSAHSERWENALYMDPDAVHGSDLIILATGDWPAENAMNKYALSQEKFPPVLYGWAEGYAAAGHSFAVMNDGGCFNCAFDDTMFKFSLTEFKSEHQRLPTCGGIFQPFRSLELAPINAMISTHAIDILTKKTKKSQIRSWVGSHNVLSDNKGKWTNIAEQEIKGRGAITGQFFLQRDFEKIEECSICGGKVEKCDLLMA